MDEVTKCDAPTAAFRPTTRPDVSLGDLMSLFLAWEAGEISEGRLAEVTGIDRITLRFLKQNAIDQAIRLVERRPEEWDPIAAAFSCGEHSPTPTETTTGPAGSSADASECTDLTP